MNSKFKGFTLVELLCAIVILGVLITASIMAVTRVVNTAREDEEAAQEQLIIKACESYIQKQKEDAPKAIGDVSYISIQKLSESKFLKENISNHNGDSCMKNSYVRVYKLSNNEFAYTPYLYCGNQKVDDVEYVYEPTINMYFIDNNNDNKIFDDLDNAYIYMDITGGTTKGGNPISIDKYSFTISVKDVHGDILESYVSDEIYANRKNNLNLKEKLINYVSLDNATYISINVTVKNVIGGVKEVTTTTQYSKK